MSYYKTVALLGSLGGNNYGDILISNCIIQLLNDLSIANDTISIDILGRKLSKKNKKPTNFSLIKSSVYQKINSRLLIKQASRSIFKQTRESNLFLFGGGNLLNTSLGCIYPEIIKEVAHNLNSHQVPYAFLGTGLGHLSSEWILKNSSIFLGSRFFLAREESKLRYLEQYKVLPLYHKSIPDPAWYLIKILGEKGIVSSQKGEIGINLLNNQLLSRLCVNPLRYREELLKIALYFHKPVKLIVTEKSDFSDSQAFSNILSSHFISNQLVFVDSFDTMIDAFSGLDYFVGSRMHSLIIALCFNTPAFAYVWDSKIESMYDSIYPSAHLEWSIKDTENMSRKAIVSLSSEVNIKKLRLSLNCLPNQLTQLVSKAFN